MAKARGARGNFDDSRLDDARGVSAAAARPREQAVARRGDRADGGERGADGAVRRGAVRGAARVCARGVSQRRGLRPDRREALRGPPHPGLEHAGAGQRGDCGHRDVAGAGRAAQLRRGQPRAAGRPLAQARRRGGRALRVRPAGQDCGDSRARRDRTRHGAQTAGLRLQEIPLCQQVEARPGVGAGLRARHFGSLASRIRYHIRAYTIEPQDKTLLGQRGLWEDEGWRRDCEHCSRPCY